MDELLIEANKEKDLLFKNMKTIILSTVDKNDKPNASYAPSVIDDKNYFYIYVSMLSKHTTNLIKSNKASIMIIEDEHKSENIFARKRLTMSVNSVLINRDDKKWDSVIALMEKKFGNSITFLKDLTDFNLFKLSPTDGLLVYGFGRAFKYSGTELNKIDFLNDKGHTKQNKT